jgi:beta-galactosidase
LSHYPQAPAFYDACDELGIIVMDAIPGWQFFGPAPFEQRIQQDLQTLIIRDRNHPSVVFWENSINETEMSAAFMQTMNELAKPLIKGQGFTAGWQDHPSYDLFIPARQHAKAPDYWNKYKNTSRPIFIAEYGDWEYYAQNAGFNQTQFADLKTSERNSRHLRSASEAALLQQAFNFQVIQIAKALTRLVKPIGFALITTVATAQILRPQGFMTLHACPNGRSIFMRVNKN